MRLEERDNGLYELSGDEGDLGEDDMGEEEGWRCGEWDAMGTPSVVDDCGRRESKITQMT